jgi:excisionase family DNA binding protein
MEELMDINEVARLTKISKPTLRRYVLLKQIPYYKVICAIRFRVSEIQAWLENFRRGDVKVVPYTTRAARPAAGELPFAEGTEKDGEGRAGMGDGASGAGADAGESGARHG